MKRKYDFREGSLINLIVPCGIIDSTSYVNKEIMIASQFCRESCEHFIGYTENSREIECNHPLWKSKNILELLKAKL